HLTITGILSSPPKRFLDRIAASHGYSLESLNLFPKHGLTPQSLLLPSSSASTEKFHALKSFAFDASFPPANQQQQASWAIAFESMAKSMPALESLAIAGDGIICAKGFNALAKHCKGLKFLQLHEFAENVDAAVFVAGLKKFAAIEHVHVSFVYRVQRAGIATAASKKTGDKCGKEDGGITPVIGVTLAKNCPVLKSLKIGNGNLGDLVMEVYREVRREFG
ncbi:hypothetical protein HK100_008316, partial [Physocladia obscura]